MAEFVLHRTPTLCVDTSDVQTLLSLIACRNGDLLVV